VEVIAVMHYWDGSWGWGAWLLMTLLMVAFWGAVAWVVVSLVRNRHEASPRSQAPTSPDPLSILDERFARGEIDESEYRDRRKVLQGQK
jgi:putative membrane protein